MKMTTTTTSSWSGKMITEVEDAIDVVEAKTAKLIADADIQRNKMLKRKIEHPRDHNDDDDDSNQGESSGSSRGVGVGSSISSSALKTSLERISTDSDDAVMFCWNCGREVSCSLLPYSSIPLILFCRLWSILHNSDFKISANQAYRSDDKLPIHSLSSSGQRHVFRLQ